MSDGMGTRPILIVGGSGQIGEWVARTFIAHGQDVVSTYYRNARPGGIQLDASKIDQVREVVRRVQPRLIVNSVNARGGTDACEMDPGLAHRAHFETARNLVDAARSIGARFVQISTDYVFDGRSGPYAEDAACSPLSQLGRAKLAAEQYALALGPKALVMRTSFVFSWTPESSTKNFVMQLLESAQRGEVMRVPVDQMSNVTYAPNFAESLVELVELGATGVYHVAGTTRCSKYDWALKVVEFFGLNRAIILGVLTAELGQRGPRPLQSGFRLEKVQSALKRTRLLSLEEGLSDMEREMALASRPVEAR